VEELQGVKKVPATRPISTSTREKETISSLFKNILSLMFNDPCKAAHSVVEDALNVLKSEVIPGHRVRRFNFLMRVEFAILYNSFQQTKEAKVTRDYIWRIRWVRQSENMMLLEFRRHL
jgi:hypothetical protein